MSMRAGEFNAFCNLLRLSLGFDEEKDGLGRDTKLDASK